MSITLDTTVPIGKARLLTADVDPTAPLLTDDQYQGLLDLENGSVRLAAAQALDIMASSEALVSKKIRSQDLQTDGPAVAAELRARASELRRQVDDGYDDGDDTGLVIIDFEDARMSPPRWW